MSSKTHDAHSAHDAHTAHEAPATGADRSSNSVLGAAIAAAAVAMVTVWGGLVERSSALAAQAERYERAWAIAAEGDAGVVSALGGPLGYVTFKRAQGAQAWRLSTGPEGPATTDSIHGYGVTSGPVALTSAQARSLAAVLESPQATQVSNKRCGFTPGVAVTWQNGSHALDLLICFSCSDLQYYFDGKVVDQPYDFYRVRPALVAEVKKLFPQDQEIQALPDKK